MLRAKFFLALVATTCASPSVASSDSAPSPNWSTAKAAPKGVVQNMLRLDGHRLLWNGREASETDIRRFLGVITNQINPQPLIILSYSAQTPRDRIRRARLLVEKVVQCKPGECLELTPSRS